MEEKTIQQRRPVWIALSGLFLDTELTEADHRQIADVLKSSGYSLVELEKILFEEVYPLLYRNLTSLTGVWDGFDPDWLVENISKPKRWRLWRWPFRLSGNQINDDWQAIKKLI